MGLIGAGVLLLVLAGLAVGRRRDAEPYAAEGRPVPPGPGPVLGTVALTLVGVVIAGPVALAVPVLAVVAHLRPRLLAPVAFAAMAAAGVVAAVGTGETTAAGEGAFSASAQLLALIGLFAALVTAGRGPLGKRAAGGPGLRRARRGGRGGSHGRGAGGLRLGTDGLHRSEAPAGRPAARARRRTRTRLRDGRRARVGAGRRARRYGPRAAPRRWPPAHPGGGG